jgi:UDP-N-acetylmuramoyl-tripeptide--D-alanyl-D-alanine ligase
MTSIQDLYEIFRKHSSISTDSRSVLPGSVFFALKGPAFNGNTFAALAIEKGAAFAVVDEKKYKVNDRCLLVEDVLASLQQLANHHRQHLKIPFLAITGSNGKTTTKELIRNVLSKKFRTVATKGNLNNHIGVPLTILSIPMDTEFAVVEMGANHIGEINSYCRIAEPDFGLITNVGKAHLEGFGGFEGVKKGKGELYAWIAEHGKGIFMHGDNDFLKSMATEHKIHNIVSYGREHGYFCEGELLQEQPFLKVNWKCGSHSGEIETQIVGAYNFENILSAICVGNFFEITEDDINEAIASYQPDNSRSQVIKKGSNTIILDAYNANPTSMEAALNNFEKIPEKRKIVFLGDMAELGEESIEEHKRISEMLPGRNYEKIILVGKNFGEFAGYVNGMHFDDSVKASEWLKKHPLENSLILIKGSRSTKMEVLLQSL